MNEEPATKKQKTGGSSPESTEGVYISKSHFQIEQIVKWRKADTGSGKEYLVRWMGDYAGDQYGWCTVDELGNATEMLGAFYKRLENEGGNGNAIKVTKEADELMNYMEQVTEPRDVLVLDQCAVGSSLVINAEKNGKSRWFAADVVGSVPSTGKPLLVLQVGDDLKAMPRYFEGRGGATKEDQNRNLKLTNKVDDLEYQLKMANQERDRCAENARLAMKFLSPPGYDTAGLLRKSSKELALVDMPAFLQKVQDHMKKLNKKSAAGSGGKK